MSAHLRIWLAIAAALVVARVRAAEVAGEATPGEAPSSVEATSPGKPAPSPVRSRRAVNGHVFQPTFLLTGPFTETSFGMATIAGGGEATGPRFDLSGVQIGTRKSSLGIYGQQLDLHLGVTPDIAVRLAVQGLIFSGVTARDLLVAGATAQYGLSAGLTAGKNLGSTMRLSFVVDFGLEPQFSLLVGSALLRAIQTGALDGEGLTSNVERLRGTPGLSFAWAPIPALGLIAEARYIWTRRLGSEGEGSREVQGVTLGGLISLDLDPLIRFPVAVQASYRGDFPAESAFSEVDQAGLGFFYSRRTQLALGLEVLWRHGIIRPGVEPTLRTDSVIGTIWFRYYW